VVLTVACADAPATVKIYSAHDTTVFALLAALNATAAAPLPQFAANVVLELWQAPGAERVDASSFSVRVRYNGEYVDDALGCPGGRCSFEAFFAGTRAAVGGGAGAVSPETCETFDPLPMPAGVTNGDC